MAIDLTVKPIISKEKIKSINILMTIDSTQLRVTTEVRSNTGEVIRENHYMHDGPVEFLSTVINKALLVDKIYDYLLTKISGTKVAD